MDDNQGSGTRIPLGQGGCGYWQSSNGPNAVNSFLGGDFSLVPYVDVWACLSGHDDATLVGSTITQAQLATQVSTYWNLVRSQWPNAICVAAGPIPSLETNSSTTSWINTASAIQTGLATIGGPWVFINPLTGAWTNSSNASGSFFGASGYSGSSQGANGVNVNFPTQAYNNTPLPVGSLLTGTGYAGATQTYGNSSLFISSDGVHPNAAGVLFLGRIIAEMIRQGVLSL
jgi:lysophospholipase L1-like esterase